MRVHEGRRLVRLVCLVEAHGRACGEMEGDNEVRSGGTLLRLFTGTQLEQVYHTTHSSHRSHPVDLHATKYIQDETNIIAEHREKYRGLYHQLRLYWTVPCTEGQH